MATEGWCETLTQFAEQQLGDREREALWKRGVTDEQIKLFRIGCLRKRLPKLLDSGGFLAWCDGGTKLNDVFVLPLTNVLGEIRGFQFRYVDRGKKGYMDYFAGQEEPVLFGLSQAIPHMWETKAVWLVEGNFDLCPIQRVFPNVIPVMTAGVPEQVVRLLRRLVDEVWIAFDMDGAGRNGAVAFGKDYGKEFHVHDVELPRVRKVDGTQSKDPADVWEAWGDEKFGVFLRSLQSPF